jgi:hypothetical protein
VDRTIKIRTRMIGRRRLWLSARLLRLGQRLARAFAVEYWIEGNARSERRLFKPGLSVSVDYAGGSGHLTCSQEREVFRAALERVLPAIDPGGFLSNELGIGWVDDGSGFARRIVAVLLSR